MDLVLRAPSLGDTLWETIDLTDVTLDLPEVPRFVESLLGHVLTVEMGLSIDSSC